MLQGIQVTLYDVFGYLLPGFVFLAAIAILFWAVCFPTAPLPWPLEIQANWWVVAAVAYVAGHMAQALANRFDKAVRPRGSEDLRLAGPGLAKLPDDLVRCAKRKASRIAGVGADKMDDLLLYRLCDEAVAQGDASRADRDMYIYREGFYRGLGFSLLALVLALLARAWIPGAAFAPWETPQPIPTMAFWLLGVLCAAAALLSYERAARFEGYKLRQAVLGFLVLQAKAAEGKEKAK